MKLSIIDAEVWRCDLINRGYTIEETTKESSTLIVLKKDAVEVARIETPAREGFYILRERFIGKESVLYPLLTTTERDAIVIQPGFPILNITAKAVQAYEDSGWI